MTIKNKVTGELAQVLTCQLDPEQAVYADARKFLWKTANVGMETRLTSPAAAQAAQDKGGGFLAKALATATEVGKRALSGQSLAFQWFRPAGGAGLVSFAGVSPGQIRVLELDGGTGWYAEHDAFICAEEGIGFGIAFAGLRAGRKGGDGFVLEHFDGCGTLVVAGGGSLIEVDPANYGGKIQCHGGAVAAFADTVTFGVEWVGALNTQTVMNAAFGGQGLHLVTLTGAGTVLLQSTTFRQLEYQEDQDQAEARGNYGGGGILNRL